MKPPLLSRSRWIWRRVLLSLWAALIGWLAFVILVFLFFTLAACFTHPMDFGGAVYMAFIFGFFAGLGVLPVCLFLLVPLSLFIPDTSIWWKPRYLILSGVVAGPLLVLIYFHGRISDDWSVLLGAQLMFGLPAAFIGGVTCAMGARLHRKILEKESAEFSSQN